MIRDALVPVLRKRFPRIGFVFQENGEPFAKAPSPCETLGGLEIYDDGDEATVSLPQFTHSHFSPNRRMPEIERDAWISASVVSYLDALFGDRLLLFRSPVSMQGGSQHYQEQIDVSEPVPGMEAYECFVWSGPVPRNSR